MSANRGQATTPAAAGSIAPDPPIATSKVRGQRFCAHHGEAFDGSESWFAG